jgi:hypothetical protein
MAQDPPQRLGKSFRGQAHAPFRTAKDVQDTIDATKAAGGDEPGALTLVEFCSRKRITNPVMIASMRAYTKVQRAPFEKWLEIFKDH